MEIGRVLRLTRRVTGDGKDADGGDGTSHVRVNADNDEVGEWMGGPRPRNVGVVEKGAFGAEGRGRGGRGASPGGGGGGEEKMSVISPLIRDVRERAQHSGSN